MGHAPSTQLAAVDAQAPDGARQDLGLRLHAILDHHPSPGPLQRRVLDRIDQLSVTELRSALAAMWETVATTPTLFGCLFTGTPQDTDLGVVLRSFEHEDLLTSVPQLATLQRQWLAQERDLDHPRGSFRGLLDFLEAGPPDGGAADYFARLFFFQDLLHAHLVDPDLQPLLLRVSLELHHQRLAWSTPYCGGYAYQGLEAVGVQGWKPSERRLASYRIDDLLGPDDRLFDIGANCGFLSLHLAQRVRRVVGVELNPFLLNMGNEAARHLGCTNLELRAADFIHHRTDERFTGIFSLSNHHTTDTRLSMRFEEYIVKCWSLLEPGGRLFFESHNVFGPGAGKPGDDGDLELKFDVLERWFELERLHMVRAFVPRADIDKLFVVLRRRDAYDPEARRTLDLAAARRRYLDG